jgi:1-acyl-sn-glycerol-3-phosphate acyltransferase
VPRTGPVIVAANHVSFLDPAVLGSAFPRRVHFLIDASTWAHWSMNWFYRGMKAIPVDRTGGPSREAIRRAMTRLGEGCVVGIFPEGGRVRDAAMARAMEGVALLARHTGAPVVPAGIAGTAEAMPRGRAIPEPTPVRVAFGEPVRHADVATSIGVAGRDADGPFTRLLMRRIAALAQVSSLPEPA